MTNIAVNLAVKDVRQSVEWYRELLNCHSPMDQRHAHRELFDMIVDTNDNPVVIFSRWGHNKLKPLDTKLYDFPGLGVHLFIEIENFDDAWEKAQSLNAKVINEPQKSRGFNNMEFTIVDRDGYYVTISEKNKKNFI